MDRLRTIVGISVFWVALSLLGDGFTALVVPVRLAETVDPRWIASVVGLVTFIGLVAGMLTQPVAGLLSDAVYPRWGRRGPLLLGAALIVGALAMFLLLPGAAGTFVSFVLLMVAVNAAQAPQQAFIPDRIPTSWRGRAAGAKGLADLGGAFLGFLLLGALLAAGELALAIAIVATAVLGCAVATMLLVREPGETSGGRLPSRPSLRAAFAFDGAAHPVFARLVVARFLFLFGTFAVGRFFLLLVADRLGMNASSAAAATGGLLAVLTLVTAATAIPAGWIADRWGGVETMIAGSIASAVGVLLLLGAGSVAMVILFGSLMSLGSAAFASANWKLTTDAAPPAEAARFLGLANIGTAGAAAAAGLLGPVADLTRPLLPATHGTDAILVVAAGACLLSALVARPLLNRARSTDVDLAGAAAGGVGR